MIIKNQYAMNKDSRARIFAETRPVSKNAA